MVSAFNLNQMYNYTDLYVIIKQWSGFRDGGYIVRKNVQILCHTDFMSRRKLCKAEDTPENLISEILFRKFYFRNCA